MSSDDLQRRALRLLGEHHRLLKAAKNAVMPERAQLALKAVDVARDAKIAVDKFYRAAGRRPA